MEKVVYLLGAGFSAPLGLPVMSNFLERSRDMFYLGDRKKYAVFDEVFKTIAEMGKIKTYYEADLTNIEEILSILEMGRDLYGGMDKDIFLRYISDVISYYTPQIPKLDIYRLPANWYEYVCGEWDHKSGVNRLYGTFVASLLNLIFVRNQNPEDADRVIHCEVNNMPDFKYSVVTLNYDLVLENYVNFFQKTYNVREPIGFDIAKLHGSVDSEILVPPTWNKSLRETLVPSWQLAHDLLSNANYIRVIGYSLPVADSYLKYLLKSAIMSSEHLKRIDVLCRDDKNGTTQQRYDQFIHFPNYKFVNLDVQSYLATNHDLAQRRISVQNTSYPLSKLQEAHEACFRN